MRVIFFVVVVGVVLVTAVSVKQPVRGAKWTELHFTAS